MANGIVKSVMRSGVPRGAAVEAVDDASQMVESLGDSLLLIFMSLMLLYLIVCMYQYT